MHEFTAEVEELAKAVMEYSLARLKSDPPLDGPRTEADLYSELGNTITAQGLGGKETLKVFTDTLALACISTDHPRNLAFIPSAPSEYSNLFDLVVGASSLYGGSWQEGAGAVFAENQAIKWLIDIAGLPKSAGGVFVQGGTMGNLSALVVARDQARKTHPDTQRWVIACSAESHSSITSAAHVMDVDVLKIETNGELRLDGAHVAKAIDELHATTNKRVFAIVGTAGSTNLGIVDDLATLAKAAKERNIWFHVDGAYGLAGLMRYHLFATCITALKMQIHLSSIRISGSLLHTMPARLSIAIQRLAKETHTQHASYLETLHDDSWSPSDYAIHLTRRVRGLPFWFSLAAHGTDAYSAAVEEGIRLAKESAKRIVAHPNLELVREPELSIVAFTRKGLDASPVSAMVRCAIRKADRLYSTIKACW